MEDEVARAHGSDYSVGNIRGNVVQRIHLDISTASIPGSKSSSAKPSFDFKMQIPVKLKSNRYARTFGSRRLIECYVSKEGARKHKDAIIRFFSTKKLLINGRIFRAFYAHKLRVHLMEINEDYGRDPKPLVGDGTRMSLMDFISWHNNISYNSNQALSKWAAHFTMGFSTSQPGVAFEPQNMTIIHDICKLLNLDIYV